MSKTVILVTGGRCFARTTEKKIIQRWKRCLENSKTPFLVLEDYQDEYGQETFSVEIPHGLGRRTTTLLIPSVPEKLPEEERLAILGRIRNAAEEIPYDREGKDHGSE